MVLVGRPVHTDGRFEVLAALRHRSTATRQELSNATGIPRRLVSYRIDDLINLGLAHETTSDGTSVGRPTKLVHFRGDLGHTLAIQLGATSTSVGISDLSGTIHSQRHQENGRLLTPEEQLTIIDDLCTQVTDELGPEPTFWGVGVGVTGPINPQENAPNKLFSMPGWAGYPLRERLSRRYNAPVWLDNEVNMLAIGEHRAGAAKDLDDLLYVKVGTGIGVGIISGGTLIRGALGASGEIGHTRVHGTDPVDCFCGGRGCLVETIGGYALARQGTLLARQGTSPLTHILHQNGKVTSKDIAAAAAAGDPPSMSMLVRAGTLIGRALADIVIVTNPSLIIIGGGLVHAGQPFLDAIRHSLTDNTTPRAATHLSIVTSTSYDHTGLTGAAWTAADGILTPDAINTSNPERPFTPARP